MKGSNEGLPTGRRRVYMQFMLRNGWQCQFLEEDLRTPLPRRFTFASADKVRDLIARSGTQMNREACQALDYAIEMGRGGVWLDMDPEKYAKLTQEK